MLHTPFEAFLFFQSLRTINFDSSIFSKVSEILNGNVFVKENATFNSDRLSPESLRQLYLHLVEEEVRTQKLARISPTTDGGFGPRKRKLSSPPIYSVDEAAEHNHLLPQLIDRLYTHYRGYVIQSIREEEDKYRSLQNAIHEIEAGDWDAQFQQQENVARKETRGVSSIQTLLHHDDEYPSPSTKSKGLGASPMDNAGLKEMDYRHVPGISNLNGLHSRSFSPVKPDTPRGSSFQSQHARTPSGGQASPLHQETFPTLSRPSSRSRMTESQIPHLPPISQSFPSPTTDSHRRLSHQQSQMGAPPSASPRLNQIPLIPPDRSSASPIILPPPPGMLRSTGSSGGPLDPLGDYRPTQSISSPRPLQGPVPPQHSQQLPQPRNYMQGAYPYYDRQVPYNPSYQAYGQPPLSSYHSPNQPGVPPYPSSNHVHGPIPRPNNLPQHYSPLTPHTQYQGYPPSQPPYQPVPLSATTPQGQTFRQPIQSTPTFTPSGRQRPPRPSPINTSALSTKWKTFDRPEFGNSPGSPTPPGPEDISPISEKAPSPIFETTVPSKSISKGSAYYQSSFNNHLRKPEETPLQMPTSSKKIRGGRSRGGASKVNEGRAGSVASTVLAGSTHAPTRSQSLASNVDELSLDNTPSASRRIKPEPPATPATAVDDGISAASTPIDDHPRTARRIRQDTARNLESMELPRPSTKRKRAHTIEGPPEVGSESASRNKPKLVLASRNFPRTSAPIMNEITTHKLASMFAKPLTERDAPGYKDLIYRPQDLKSIKSAISAGSRAVAATADQNTPADDIGSPGRPTANLWIEANKDIVPPRGIVNSAQLEKEICRMFANAVMFNPDPKRGIGPAFKRRAKIKDGDDKVEELEPVEEERGGVVSDTREMFVAVEKSVGIWRSAERVGEEGRREESERDELAVEEEGEEEGNGKKRKRA
ncbi:hypothetical protein MMC14_009974 [Varicellaria rhodocarpa]|nr:hypothetical protein [Varicellaria rhodocarpa]